MRVKDNFKVIDHRLVELSSLSNEVMIERLKRVESRRKEIADEIHELDKMLVSLLVIVHVHVVVHQMLVQSTITTMILIR